MSRRLHRCVAVLLGLALAVVGLSMAAAADDEHAHNGHGQGVDKAHEPSGPSEPDLGHSSGQQPCTGCVGEADHANPPGQMDVPPDANNGYDCDQNQGVGAGNPAHAACAAPSAPSAPEAPTAEAPEVVGVAALESSDAPLPSDNQVLGVLAHKVIHDEPSEHPELANLERAPVRAPAPSVAPAVTEPLPSTGVPIDLWLSIAALLFALGLGLVIATRAG